MILSAPDVLAAAAIAPILGLIVIGRVKAYRSRAAGPPDESAGTRFEPEPERTPALFLGRFTLPQRTYLKQQFSAARICFVLCAYIFFVAAGIGLLPDQLPFVTAASHDLHIWRRYQDQLTMAGYFAEVSALFTAAVVVATLQSPPYGNFNRTRPLSLRFLFRGRAFIVLAGLLVATQAGLLASILLLRFTYGPVWKAASTPSRSVFQLDLSMLTTTALLFSLCIFLAFIPRSWRANGKSKFIPALLGAVFGSQLFSATRFLSTTFAAKILFWFPAEALPQRYPYALVPLGCAVALLFLAERLSARFEV
jgi:hypothetical protein